MPRIIADNLEAELEGLTFNPSRVRPGQRWLYSAGANIQLTGRAQERLTEELGDLKALATAGAEVIVLSHQGSSRDGTAGSIEHVAHAWRKMGLPVLYDPDPMKEPRQMGSGPASITLLRNTRLNPGEEQCDPALARAYSRLAPRAVVGGFSKSHRRNASNTGILPYMPAWVSRGLVKELSALAPFRTGPFGLITLGGMKREKILALTSPLADRAKLILPAGGVLNALRTAFGYGQEASLQPRLSAYDTARLVRAAIRHREKLILPVEICQREKATGISRWTPANTPTIPGSSVVDLRWAESDIQRMRDSLSRFPGAIIAGPPGDTRHAHDCAANTVETLMAPLEDRALYLGGDTCAELNVTGSASSGGGAAIAFLASGTCLIVEELKKARGNGAHNQ